MNDNLQPTNKIKVLPPQEAQKIAAGEVVERPSSVVKEMVENSIDAGANQISLYIEKAGKDLIRVVDNGEGMSQTDAKICFVPHATSKITSIEDLEKISTFGFRGEALATISAVSKVLLTTKHKDDKSDLGIKIEFVDGKILKEEKTSCSFGTDLQIRDLFYNTPVRKKFLKQDETEWNQILNVFNAFCLSNLDVHFKLFRDNKLIINAPVVEDVKSRVSQLWGHNFSQNLIALNSPKNLNIDFTGLISNHNFWRYGRQQIFFFVNKRYVKNKELSKALFKGYLNVLPPARFPAAFIFLDLENTDVDVNVHPRKEEVQFSKPKTIEMNLQRLVKEALEENLSSQLTHSTSHPPSLKLSRTGRDENFSSKQVLTDYPIFNSEDFKQSTNLENNKINFAAKENNLTTVENISNNKFVYSGQDQEQMQSVVPKNNTGLCEKKDGLHFPVCPEEQTQFASRRTRVGRQNIIGQLLNTYILIEGEDGLVMIDQHAAHERVLYEKFLNKFENKQGTRLLFPEIIKLSENQIKIILQQQELFKNQGIEIDRISDNEIAIKTSPPKIQNNSLKELVFETIAFIEENENLEQDDFRKKLNEHVHSHMACKMAIKAGDKLTIEQMQQLIDDLQKTKNRFICVHGRPTTWSLGKYQIEKNFRRK